MFSRVFVGVNDVRKVVFFNKSAIVRRLETDFLTFHTLKQYSRELITLWKNNKQTNKQNDKYNM